MVSLCFGEKQIKYIIMIMEKSLLNTKSEVVISSHDGCKNSNIKHFSKNDQAPFLYVKAHSKNKTNFYVLDAKSRKIINVLKEDFKRRENPIITLDEKRIKYKNCNKKEASAISLLLFKTNIFKPQGLSNKFKKLKDHGDDIISGLKWLLKTITTVGAVERKMSDLLTSTKEVFHNIKSFLGEHWINVSRILINIIRLIKNYQIGGVDFLDMTAIFIDIMAFIPGLNNFKKQGMESLMLSSLSMLMPKSLLQIFKNMSVFTSKKLFDDKNLLFTFLERILDLIRLVLSYFPEKISTPVLKFVNEMGFIEIVLQRNMHFAVFQYDINKQIILKNEYRKSVLDIFEKLKCQRALEYLKSNGLFETLYKDFMHLHKCVESYENCSRVEPNCFVFEGPPGCRKSVLINKLIKALGKTHYAHSVKTVNDSKDFYDTYNSEDIFYMDDVGQMGKSQWRHIINWVSCVKLPLECAQAHLKDTKFFNSEMLFITTNCFKDLNGFTSTDSISHPEALWRRGDVFDFKNIKVINNKLQGSIVYYYYDIKAKAFISGLRPELKRLFEENKVELNGFCDASNELELLKWMSTIIMGMNVLKRKYKVENSLTEIEIENIRSSNPFMKQGLTTENLLKDNFSDLETEYESECESDLEEEDITTASTMEEIRNIIYSIRDETNLPVIPDSNVSQQFENALKVYDNGNIGNRDSIFETIKNNSIKLYHESIDKISVLQDFISQTSFLSFVKNLITSSMLSLSDLFLTFCSGIKFDKLLTVPIMITSLMMVAFGIRGFYTIKQMNNPQIKPKLNKIKLIKENEDTTQHNLIAKVSAQTRWVEIKEMDGEFVNTISSMGIMSEHLVILPNHNVLHEEIQLTIYKDKDLKVRILDNSLAHVLWRDLNEDVCIVQISHGFPTPAKNLKAAFAPITQSNSKIHAFCFPQKPIIIEGVCKVVSNNDMPIYYDTDFGEVCLTNFVEYQIQKPGYCGAPIVDNFGHILGFHVAGCSDSGKGVSILWSERVRNIIGDFLNKLNTGLKPSYTMKNKILEDTSGFPIDCNNHISTPKKTNYVKSPLYGIFPITRKPANLNVYGDHTIKDLFKNNLQTIATVNQDELKFAEGVISMIIQDFGDLTEKEVVLGNEVLSKMNNKSSNGIFPLKTKEDCFDYENGLYKLKFRKLYSEFMERMRSGNVEINDICAFETVKDELRNVDKIEPRTFRVAPVTTQVLAKTCFGKMVEQIYRERWFNQIMIGINPFKEWPKLYDRLTEGKIFAGDIGKYDKGMLVQVQLMVIRCILSKYRGEEYVAARNLLENLPYNIVSVNDDTWILTHSLPSGCWLTAVLNSLVNKAYTAMWYYREFCANQRIEPTTFSFFKNLHDFVYGDDRVNVCKNKQFENFLNAKTMLNFFTSINMTFTDSKKQPITTPFQPFHEITFLKRNFTYHPKLKQIVAPLDLNTLYSGLSWIDSSKDQSSFLDKLNNFQREIYLHDSLYEVDTKKMLQKCDENHIPVSLLPPHYLQNLYLSDEGFEYTKEITNLI